MSALARWDAFLAQIQKRHEDVRAEALAAGRQMVAQLAGGGDYQVLSHQLGAVKHRLHELEAKIMDTWHAQAMDAILDEGHSEATRDLACDKALSLGHALEDARDELEMTLLAELARARYQVAASRLAPAVCARCGAQYTPPQSFRLVEWPCAQCGSVVRYDPDELMRSAGAIGTHPVAQEAALAEWRQMRAADRRMRQARSPRPLAVLKDSEAAQLAYWRRYLAARAYFEPELARDPELEVRSRMEQWYLYTAEQEESWRAAGRPRAI